MCHCVFYRFDLDNCNRPGVEGFKFWFDHVMVQTICTPERQGQTWIMQSSTELGILDSKEARNVPINKDKTQEYANYYHWSHSTPRAPWCETRRHIQRLLEWQFLYIYSLPIKPSWNLEMNRTLEHSKKRRIQTEKSWQENSYPILCPYMNPHHFW